MKDSENDTTIKIMHVTSVNLCPINNINIACNTLQGRHATCQINPSRMQFSLRQLCPMFLLPRNTHRTNYTTDYPTNARLPLDKSIRASTTDLLQQCSNPSSCRPDFQGLGVDGLRRNTRNMYLVVTADFYYSSPNKLRPNLGYGRMRTCPIYFALKKTLGYLPAPATVFILFLNNASRQPGKNFNLARFYVTL